jgi:DNA-directed RNA polymerase I subunit RPA1
MFTVTIHFYPINECKKEYDTTSSEILAAFGAKFPQILKKELMVEMKRLQADIKTHLADVGKGKASNDTEANETGVDEDGEEALPKAAGNDNDSEIGDGDATAEKRARQSKQQTTYESDDDDDDGEPPKEYNDEALEAEYENGSSDEDEEMEVDSLSKRKTQGLGDQVNVVREMFMGNLKTATSFSFNESQAKFELEVMTLFFHRSETVRSVLKHLHSLDLTFPSCFSSGSLKGRA